MENEIPNSLPEKIKYIYEIRKVSSKFSDDTLSEPVQIKKCLREGCCLSSIIFNMYIDNIIREFNIVIKMAPN